MKTKLCMLLIGLLSISMVGTAHAVTFKWVEQSIQPPLIEGSITFDDAQWLAGGTLTEASVTDFKWLVDNENGSFDFAGLIPSATEYRAKFDTQFMVTQGLGFNMVIDPETGYELTLNELQWKAIDTQSGWGEAGGWGHWEMTDPPAAVPEPASMLLLGSGLLGLALFRKKRDASNKYQID